MGLAFFSHLATGEKSFLVALHPVLQKPWRKARKLQRWLCSLSWKPLARQWKHYFSCDLLLRSGLLWYSNSLNREPFHLICAAQICTLLTSREAIPDLQPVIATEHTSRGCLVRFQLETLEFQNDLRHLGSEDHECAVQVVWVFLWKARGLYDAAVGGEVSGTFWTCRNKKQRQSHEMRWNGGAKRMETSLLRDCK